MSKLKTDHNTLFQKKLILINYHFKLINTRNNYMKKKNLTEINKYYSRKIIKFGATSRGVDWNGKVSHFLRFEQLCKILERDDKFSLLDYGCGFGSLIDFLEKNNYQYQYFGYDISMEMLKKAKSIYSSKKIQFNSVLNNSYFDYTIANGIFNVKLDYSEIEWNKYILDTMKNHEYWGKIIGGFSEWAKLV